MAAGDKRGFTGLPGGGIEREREGEGEGGGEREGGWEKRSGARKVDLPVAQLLAARSLYYLLRLESPVSQGRIVEEAKICHRRQTSK